MVTYLGRGWVGWGGGYDNIAYGFDLDRLDGLGGWGGVFTFECTAWWRVYIYYVWLCLGSREYWLLDLTLRE